MMDARLPLSLGNVKRLLSERGLDICHATVRLWWDRFGPVRARPLAPHHIADFPV